MRIKLLETVTNAVRKQFTNRIIYFFFLFTTVVQISPSVLAAVAVVEILN